MHIQHYGLHIYRIGTTCILYFYEPHLYTSIMPYTLFILPLVTFACRSTSAKARDDDFHTWDGRLENLDDQLHYVGQCCELEQNMGCFVINVVMALINYGHFTLVHSLGQRWDGF